MIMYVNCESKAYEIKWFCNNIVIKIQYVVQFDFI